MSGKLTSEEAEAAVLFARLLFENSIAPDSCLYQVAWDDSEGFWQPCLACVMNKCLEWAPEPCPPCQKRQAKNFFDNRNNEMLRMVDLITLEWESLDSAENINPDLDLFEIWKKLLPDDEAISWEELNNRLPSIVKHLPASADLDISVIYKPQVENEIHEQLRKDKLWFATANHLLNGRSRKYLALTIINVPLSEVSKLEHLARLEILFQEPEMWC